MDLNFRYQSETIKIKVERQGDAFEVTLPDGSVHLVEETEWESPTVVRFRIGERCLRVPIGREGSLRRVSWQGIVYTFEHEIQKRPRRAHHSQAEGVLTAPMPGMIIKVLVQEGETVQPHQRLIVLEAMKTEQAVIAPFEGKISRIYVQENQIVTESAPLVEVIRET